MADETITEIIPHEQVLLIAVRKRSLDESSTRELIDDIETAAADTPRVPIVLDLSDVKFAPSVALGSLVRLTKSLTLDNRRIALIGLDKRVRESVRVTQLHRILEIHNTLEQAITAMTK
jgi:anti-anti-sigma factor